MKHYKQFTKEQRYQISGLKKAGLNQSRIADEVDVNKSTISHEFRRNKGLCDRHPKQAQKLRDERRASKPMRLDGSCRLRRRPPSGSVALREIIDTYYV